MALFKIYSGTSDDFNGINGFANYALHPGYAYFFEDSGEFVVDTEAGRFSVNAPNLIKSNGSDTTLIEVDDVLFSTVGITSNSLLVGGNTNNDVKSVSIANGQVVIGNSTNGVAGLEGVGALFATTKNSPKFGTLPVSAGGTGATTVAKARTNLDVYSKSETDTNVETATSKVYTVTLNASSWTGTEADGYVYNYSNTSIRCGKNGDVHPIITYLDNLEEYSNITSAEATVGTGIVFTSPVRPQNNIRISIMDVG